MSDSIDDRLAAIDDRLAATERAVTDSDTPVADLADAATVEERLTALETTIADLSEQVAELDAAVQAIRGYAGSIRAVNTDVEKRADLALTKVEALERDAEDSGLVVERLDSEAVPESTGLPADSTPTADTTTDDESHARSEPKSDGSLLTRLTDLR